MRITKMEIEGPKGSATLYRERSSGIELIAADIQSGGAAGTWHADIHAGDSQTRLAKRLHKFLEGFEPCAGDLAPYLSAVQSLGD